MREPTHEFEHGYTCDQVVELATDYVERALPPELVEPFEMHLNFFAAASPSSSRFGRPPSSAAASQRRRSQTRRTAKLLASFRDWQRR